MFKWIRSPLRKWLEHQFALVHASFLSLNRKVDAIMAVGVETARVIADIDAETTRIAVKLAEVIANSDLTPEEKAAFDSLIVRLKAIGADPENPVPPPPPA